MTVGSPPLARGVREVWYRDFERERITPACAGSTIYKNQINAAFKDHPRLRGEYASLYVHELWGKGSPPLARGVLYHNFLLDYTLRITPACAGSTEL